jgi:hypothetical protein
MIEETSGMHKQDISGTGKGTDALVPRMGRLNEKVSEVINDCIQIKREDKKKRISTGL